MKRSRRCLAVVLAILVLTMLAGCGGAEKSRDEVPDFEQMDAVTEPPTLPPVQVSMPEYELTYSGELADVIVMEEVADPEGLKFSVKLSGGEAHMFTLYYNSEDGDLVTVLTDAAGEKIPVAFQMATIPEGLDDADAHTFYTAQEAVNEIVASLTVK